MKLNRLAGASLALTGALVLGACAAPAGAAELAEINAQLVEVQAAITEARQALDAAGLEVPELTSEEAETPASAAGSTTFAEFTELESFVARAMWLEDWQGQQVVEPLSWDTLMASCMTDRNQVHYYRTPHSFPRDSREFAVTYGFDIVAHRNYEWRNPADNLSAAEANAHWEAHMECANQMSAIQGLFWQVSNDFLHVRDQLMTLRPYDPRQTMFRHTWLACLADAGFTPDDDRNWWGVHDLISWNELDQALQQPIDASVLATWDWTANPQGPVNPAVAEFAEREIALATANWDCRDAMGYREFRQTVNRQLIDDAIAQFGPQLEEWMAAYDAALAELTS